jgi:hypothetical protein
VATGALHARIKWYNFIVFAACALPFLLFGSYLVFKLAMGLLAGKAFPGFGISLFILLVFAAGVYFTTALLKQLTFLTIAADRISQRGLFARKTILVEEIVDVRLDGYTYVKALGIAQAVSCATITSPSAEIVFMYDNYRNADEIKRKLGELAPAKPPGKKQRKRHG